jgi:hypothetical protein
MARTSRLKFLLPGLALAFAAGCADQQPTGSPVIVDPTKTQRGNMGTDDVSQVCQQMVTSMRRSKQLEARTSKKILLEKPDVDPALHGTNALMLYNQFMANLNRVAAGEYEFVDRNAVAAERSRQLTGEVKTSGVDKAPAGADLILTIQLIAQRSGETTAVQYNFKMVDMNGVTQWTDTSTILKRN